MTAPKTDPEFDFTSFIENAIQSDPAGRVDDVQRVDCTPDGEAGSLTVSVNGKAYLVTYRPA